MSSLLKRGRVRLITIALGGGMLALQGCDPNVRDTILNGVGGAATSLAGTFIEALIQSVQNKGTEETPTSVRADIDVTPQVYT